MKRYIFIILIFAIISVSCTAMMIFIKNNENNKQNDIEMKNETEDIITVNIQENNTATEIKNNQNTYIMEKTLDLYGTHNDNDITYEMRAMSFSGEDIEGSENKMKNFGYSKEDIPYLQIGGLKDKTVEQKINNSIKQKIYNIAKLFLNKNNITDYFFHCSLESNFSNTISLFFSYSANSGDEYIYEEFGLNYELINGEEIKFEDLFKTGADINKFPRISLYRYLAEKSMFGEWGGYSDIRYDANKQTWLATYYWYEDDGKEHIEETEYVPPMTDYDIEKKVKKFINSTEKNFYYTPSTLIMYIDGIKCEINLYDVPEDVVIYDKYLTNTDLYENHNIGAKSIINCSAERNYGKYKETKYETNNLFYDIDTRLAYRMDWMGEISEKNNAINYLDNKAKEEANNLKEELQRYKEMASNNPNKAYFVFLETDIYNNDDKPNNLIQISKNTMIISCDIQHKKEVLDEILSGYRYYNMGFYGSIYGYLMPSPYYTENEIQNEYSIEENEEVYYYNMFNGKEIKSIKDIFIDGIDYENILKQYIPYYNEQNIEYEFDLSGIEIHYNSDDTKSIKYDQLKPYVIVRDLKPYILEDVSTRKYDKSELQNLTEDELTIAYNEPFAKHGHDFQTKYLKDYFSNWDWYKPISGKTVGLEELNEIEKYNVELIKTVMD